MMTNKNILGTLIPQKTMMKKNLKLFISSTLVALTFAIPQKVQGAEDHDELVEKVYDSTVTYSAGIFEHHQEMTTLSTTPKRSTKAYSQRAFMYEKAPQELKREKVLKKVIPGQDGRARISQTTQWPYNICAQLTMVFDGNTYGGSGSLVGPHHVLTCGHNVYDSDDNIWAEKILVYPALNDSSAPFGEVKVVKVVTFTDWVSGGNPAHDMALLILNKSIGKYTGWGGLLSTADMEISQQTVHITGYPGDKGLKQMWSMSHQLKKVNPEQFDYEIDTYGGQSGSPVWVNKWGLPMILGVHTQGSNSINSGVRLSEKKFTKLLSIISETYALNSKTVTSAATPAVAAYSPPAKSAPVTPYSPPARYTPAVASSPAKPAPVAPYSPPARSTTTSYSLSVSTVANAIPHIAPILVPSVAQGHEDVYQRFLNGRLIYKPNQDNDLGKIELRIADLANPLEGTFDLSRCGNTSQYLSISTGYRKGKKAENANKVEIWFTPRFLVEKEINGSARHFEVIFSANWSTAAPVGIFWTWGGWDNLTYMDHLTTQCMDEVSNNNLYEKWRVAEECNNGRSTCYNHMRRRGCTFRVCFMD